MADLKEETTVENRPDTETAKRRSGGIDTSMEGLQFFYEKNKNLVNYVGGALLVIIAAFVYFKAFYLPEQETEAANELFWAQDYFEKDSFAVALAGGRTVISPDGQKPMMGFEAIADEYGLTKSGKLANYYAGISHLRLGNFEQAIGFLKEYKGDDQIVSSIAIGAMGDCYMELNNLDEAVKYYTRAADNNSNTFTTPIYLKKAGLAQELKGDFNGALNSYQRIEKEFSSTEEGREISRDIARVKALGNL